MTQIKGIAKYKIHESKLEEFKRLSAKCMEIVRAKDSGTFEYEQFFNEDQTECMVFERYRDSAALLEHFANLGDTANEIMATGELSGFVLGDANPELRKMLNAAGVPIYTSYQSL